MAENKPHFINYLFCMQVIINHIKYVKSTKLVSTQIETKHKCTNINHNIFKEIVPSILLLLRKYIRSGHTGIVDPSV